MTGAQRSRARLGSTLPFPRLGDPEWARAALRRLDAMGGAHGDAYGAARADAYGAARADAKVIDYFEQAPCLMEAYLGGPVLDRMIEGARLRIVMREAGFAPPLRALSARAINGVGRAFLAKLSALPPSVLAQAIPQDVARQRIFVTNCEDVFSLDVDGVDPARFRLWAAQRLCGCNPPIVRVVMDYVSRGHGHIDPKWTADMAVAAAERWHRTLALEGVEKAFFQELKIGFEEAMSYGDFDLEAAAAGHEFLALQSGRALFEEGVAMHHCVGSYSADVIRGDSRIYSVRKDGKRVATLELKVRGGAWVVAQLSGPCNAAVDWAVENACAQFAAAQAAKRAPRACEAA